MLPGWARALRDQCRKRGIPFHFKQWGHWAPTKITQPNKKVTEFWDEVEGKHILMESKGKKEAGRALDGMTWDEVPVAA